MKDQPTECPKLAEYPCVMTETATEARLIKQISQCVRCGWVDPVSLDAGAEEAFKQQMSRNAQNIAVAVGTEPFTFVDRPDEPLSLRSALGQALGAASMCWKPPPYDQEFDSFRAKKIYEALLIEVEAAMENSWQYGAASAQEETDG